MFFVFDVVFLGCFHFFEGGAVGTSMSAWLCSFFNVMFVRYFVDVSFFVLGRGGGDEHVRAAQILMSVFLCFVFCFSICALSDPVVSVFFIVCCFLMFLFCCCFIFCFAAFVCSLLLLSFCRALGLWRRGGGGRHRGRQGGEDEHVRAALILVYLILLAVVLRCCCVFVVLLLLCSCCVAVVLLCLCCCVCVVFVLLLLLCCCVFFVFLLLLCF